MLLGDPINVLIPLFALGFLFMCGVIAGRQNRKPSTSLEWAKPRTTTLGRIASSEARW